MKKQDDFAHEDPKMEKRSGWAPGTALDFQKPNCKQMEGLQPPSDWDGWRVGIINERPSETGKVLQPLRRVAGKMVIIGETRSWILKATPAEIQEGWAAGGLERGKEKGAPALPPPTPEPAPPTSPGAAERSGRGQTRGESYHQIG